MSSISISGVLENVGVDSELLPVLEPPPPHAAMLVKQSNGSDLKILCVIPILSKCPANDQIRVDAIHLWFGIAPKTSDLPTFEV